jgi:hypothetical protein
VRLEAITICRIDVTRTTASRRTTAFGAAALPPGHPGRKQYFTGEGSVSHGLLELAGFEPLTGLRPNGTRRDTSGLRKLI